MKKNTILKHSLRNFTYKQIEDSCCVKQKLLQNDELLSSITKINEIMIEAYNNNYKILLAGNGGSASDAQHIAGELVSRFYFDRPALPALALTTDTSILTAIGNDYGYSQIFSRQIEANANKGDIFIGISTSGNSENILNAINTAKEKKIITIGLTGQTGGKMKELCDYCLCIPSNETPRIQEAHILIGHIFCASIEEALFGKSFN